MSELKSAINAFVTKLATIEPLDNVTNQYSLVSHTGDDDANAVRRSNFANYLTIMANVSPAVLLVGEAPGYKGCRWTGIPFTSEYILLNNDLDNWIARHGGAEQPPKAMADHGGFRKTRETTTPVKEATATIVWSTLFELDCCPLLWNAFPYHPHKPGKPDSNRRPLQGELKIGRQFLEELCSLFEIETVVAVGKTAGMGLKMLGQDAQYIRHPSHGGKADFARGLVELCASHQMKANSLNELG